MDVSRALDQIAEIHQHIAKAEVYRGYRSLPVAASGAMGLAAACLQPRGLSTVDPLAFTVYGLAIATFAGGIGASEIVYNYAVRERPSDRRRTRRVVGQFLPSLVVGAAISVCLAHLSPGLVALLPGLWALCFGIGVVASRPYLPRASGAIALFYCASGVLWLWTAGDPVVPTQWQVGGTFGVGQILAAMVLWWNLERDAMESTAVVEASED